MRQSYTDSGIKVEFISKGGYDYEPDPVIGDVGALCLVGGFVIFLILMV